MTTTWAAAFGDGWNGSLVNPMSRAEAAARDHAGDPYAVVLFADGRVRAEIRVAWAETYAAVVRYDAGGRRRSVHEFRPDDEGGLTPWATRTWDAADGFADDEFPSAARERDTSYRGTDPGRTLSAMVRTPAPRFPRPAFGRWSELLDRAGAGPVEVTAAATDELPTSRGDGLPWRPPRPLAPADLAGLFTDGAARPIDEGRVTARIEVVPAGRLRMPSGRLIVADPGDLGMGGQPEPFVVTVDPGVYPAAVSRAHLPDGRTRVAGIRLQIADRPVMSWQMALQPGQEVLDLAEGDYFGVGVDTGAACLVDAGSWAPLDETVDSYELVAGLAPAALVGDGAMLACLSGWGNGCYPTWIGRDAAGEVVCFITDMLL